MNALTGLGIVDPDLNIDGLRQRYPRGRGKRIKLERDAQFIETRAEYQAFAEDPFVDGRRDTPPVHDEVEVVIVDAGLAGPLMGARLREAGTARVRLVDKAGGVGGTWDWNRYPGVSAPSSPTSIWPSARSFSTS